ncbi:MAG TPA: MarR family transcriptional regulator [Dehalococcoidia bacterium]|nr:MarR family transcriptional regulator [Dehalococcoidia bacterium]
MERKLEDKIEDLAHEIREQANRLSVDNFITFLHTADMVERYVDIEMRKVGINRTNFSLLNHLIVLGGRATPTELSRRVFRSKHAVTRAVDTLEREGLVKREGIGEDRRNRKVTITTKGLNLVRKMVPFREEVGSRIMSPLNKTEAEQLSTILRRLRRHLNNLITQA